MQATQQMPQQAPLQALQLALQEAGELVVAVHAHEDPARALAVLFDQKVSLVCAHDDAHEPHVSGLCSGRTRSWR